MYLKEWKPSKQITTSKIPLQAKLNKNKQKLIVCHDMKGGYNEDQFNQGVNNQDNFNKYTFNQWKLTDIFIYFSHSRITIPPTSWINNCHKNNIICLGTFITEWEDGKLDNTELINNPNVYIDKLIEISEFYKFDGWFLNIEVDLKNKEETIKMKQFLKELTIKIHKINDKSIVLWYDSIIRNGKVKWQNELNEENYQFFNVCDGIFLNYDWNKEILKSSCKLAKNRKYDVYTGIDVFGRSKSNGKYESFKSVKEIGNLTSIALFAPGYTFEDDSGNVHNCTFNRNEQLLWNGISHVNQLKNELKNWIIVRNGGNGFKVSNNKIIKDYPIFETSYDYCIKSQEVNLDEFENDTFLIIEDFFKGIPPNVKDKYKLVINLLDEYKNTLYKYDTTELTCSNDWKCMKKVIFLQKNYKFLKFEHSGKSIEYWSGHYGTIITGSSIYSLKFNITSISTLIQTKILNVLNYKTNFNQGKGEFYFINGQQVISKNNWYNINQQDEDYLSINNNKRIYSFFDFEDSYNGGSNLNINCMLNINEKVEYLLYNCNLEYKHDSILSIIIKNENYFFIRFVLNDGSKLDLNVKTENTIHLLNNWIQFKFKFQKCHIKQVYLVFVNNVKKLKMINLKIGNITFNYKPTVRNEVEIIEKYTTFNLSNIYNENYHQLYDLNIHWKLNSNFKYYQIYINNKYHDTCYNNKYKIINSLNENEIKVFGLK